MHSMLDRAARGSPRASTARSSATGLPWHVVRLGARVELVLRARRRCATGGEAKRAAAGPGAALHLFLLNRGVLITPFHNMMLISPATSEDEIDRLCRAFGELPRRPSRLSGMPPDTDAVRASRARRPTFLADNPDVPASSLR